MKSWTVITVLCLLAGQASASCPSPELHEYVYDLNAAVLSTSTTPANQFAGLIMTGKVKLQVAKERTAFLSMQDVTVIPINDEISDIDNFEDVPMKRFENWKPQGMGALLQIIYDKDGSIKDIMASSKDIEEVWPRNLKNALATIFQLDMTDGNENHVSSPDARDKVLTRWENGILGKCKVTYLYDEQSSPFNATAPVLNVTKLKDLSNCEEVPMFIRTSHQPRECEDCDSPDIFTTHVATNYNLLREGKKYIFRNIEKKAISKFAPVGFDADYFEVTQLIKLKLISRRYDPSILNMKDIDYGGGSIANKEQESFNLHYRFPDLQDLRLPTQNLNNANPRLLDWGEESYTDKCVEFIEEAAELVHDDSIENNKELPSVLMRAAMACENLDYKELEEAEKVLFPDKPKRATEKQFFVDIVSISGTNPAFKMIKKWIKNREVQGERAVQLLQQLPNNHKAPSVKVLEEMKDLCDSESVKNHNQMLYACWMAFGSMLGQGCGYGIPSKPTPPIVDRLCKPEETKRLVEHVGELMDRTTRPGLKMALLTALGNMAVPYAIPYIKSYANGRKTSEYSDLVQIKAIYSMKDYGKTHEEEVINAMLPIVYNEQENFTVQVAAVNVILACHPTFHIFEKMATYTWRSSNDRLKAYLYSAFDSLANSTDPCLQTMSSHAEHALQLIDDECEDGYGVGSYHLFENDIEDTELSTVLRLALVGEDSSPIFFEKLHAALFRNVNGYRSPLLEASMNALNVKSFADHIIGPEGAFKRKSKSFVEILEDVDRPNANKGFEDVFNKLNIEPRLDEKTEILLTTKFLGTYQRQVYLDMERVKQLIQTARSSYQTLKSSLQNGISLNHQKVIKTFGFRVAAPSILGYPLYMVSRKFDILSLTGSVSVSFDGKPSLESDVELIATGRTSTLFGVNIPKKRELAVAGYISKYAVTAPFTAKVELDIKSRSVKFEMQNTASQRDAPLVYIRTIPYTALYQFTELKPILESAKYMTVLDSPRTNEFKVGQSILNEPLIVKTQHETFWNDDEVLYKYLHRFGPAVFCFPLFPARQRLRKYELYWQQSNPISAAIDLSWNHKLAATQPEFHPITDLLGIWGRLSPLSRMPTECSDEDENEKPWELASGMSNRMSRLHRSRGHSSDEDEDENPWGSSAGASHKMSHSHRARGHSSNEDESDNPWGFSAGERERKSHSQRSRDQSFHSSVRKLSEKRQRHEEDNDDDESGSFFSHQQKSQSRSYMQGRYHAMESRPDFSGPNPLLTVRPYVEGVAVSQMKVKVEYTGLKIKGFKSEWTCHHDFAKRVRELKFKTELLGSQNMVCVDARLQYPKVPCRYGPQIPKVPHDAEYKHKLEITWGQGDCGKTGHISINTHLKKSDDQIDYESRPSDAGIKPWFYEQCDEDKAMGNYVSYACDQKAKHLMELHLIVSKIEYENVPAVIRNYTIKLYDHVKYVLFPYSEHNPVDVSNEKNQITVKALFHYEAPAITLKVYRPTATRFFHKVPLDLIPFVVAPPSVKYPYSRILADYVTGEDVLPDCQIAGNYVSTFDNTTFKMDWSNCEYVAAKDVSGSNLFAVLVTRDGKSLQLKVRALKHEVKISPASTQEIKINQKPHEVEDDNSVQIRDPEYNKTTIILHKAAPVYFVHLPLIGVLVRFDGFRVKVMASHFHRSKVAGLCGRFDGDSDTDFEGPQGFLYPNGKELANSYAIPSSSCSAPEVTDIRMMDESTNAISVDATNVVFRTLYKIHDKKICFTIKPYPQCKSGAKPTFVNEHDCEMTCYSRKDRRVDGWIARSKTEAIEEFLNEDTDLIDQIEVHDYCS